MHFLSTNSLPCVSPLADIVTQRLHASGRPRLRNVRVQEQRGIVLLTGHVPTYFLKQVAQSIASSVDGVVSVRNEMVVTSPVRQDCS